LVTKVTIKKHLPVADALSKTAVRFYFLAGHVFNPTKVYRGQKLTRLVNTNTPASTSNIIPNVPVTVLVKYKTAITTANNSLTMRSALPIFFFIINYFSLQDKISKIKQG
jgi:hypothetical protein